MDAVDAEHRLSCAIGSGLRTFSRVRVAPSRLEPSVIQVALADSVPLNRPSLLCVLVVEQATTALRGTSSKGTADNRRTAMVKRIARWQPDQSAAVTARAIGALALVALAVIHVVDLPGTLGPTPLVGIGYLGIISGAVLIG